MTGAWPPLRPRPPPKRVTDVVGRHIIVRVKTKRRAPNEQLAGERRDAWEKEFSRHVDPKGARFAALGGRHIGTLVLLYIVLLYIVLLYIVLLYILLYIVLYIVVHMYIYYGRRARQHIYSTTIYSTM